MRCFGFGLLNFKMWGSKTANGVSVKTLEMYALTFTARLISIMRHQVKAYLYNILIFPISHETLLLVYNVFVFRDTFHSIRRETGFTIR